MTAEPRKRVAILISGRGSNMEALLAAASDPGYAAEIAVVISNRPDAPGLAKASAAGVEALTIDHTSFADRAGFERALQLALTERRIDLVCNAGFMRLLTADFVSHWLDRHLNIHPSLLPSFKGLDTHRRAIEAGVKLSGCTVHFVRTEMDAGPIIAQAAVAVAEDDTPDSLAARVLAAEHRLYPLALALVASDRVRVVGNRTIIEGSLPPPHGALVALSLGAASSEPFSTAKS